MASRGAPLWHPSGGARAQVSSKKQTSAAPWVHALRTASKPVARQPSSTQKPPGAGPVGRQRAQPPGQAEPAGRQRTQPPGPALLDGREKFSGEGEGREGSDGFGPCVQSRGGGGLGALGSRAARSQGRVHERGPGVVLLEDDVLADLAPLGGGQGGHGADHAGQPVGQRLDGGVGLLGARGVLAAHHGIELGAAPAGTAHGAVSVRRKGVVGVRARARGGERAAGGGCGCAGVARRAWGG